MNLKVAKIMGLDLGSKTCGVSLSDGLKMFAHPYKTLYYEGDLETLKPQFEAIFDAEKISLIILGYPKMMNNDIGERALISEEFKVLLESWFDIKVILQDERMTTKQATRQLIEMDMSRKKRKKVIDQVAAVGILQSYLDSL
jgi:putative holliday junction resolvase